jgi:branched-chain amino acid transport system permease protein
VTTLALDLFLLVAAYGLVLPVAFGGLPFLGQGAFVAVGAFGTFQLAAHGCPVLVAVAVSVLAAGVAGYVVGFAAGRVGGASLALASWGLAWLGYGVLVQFPSVSGGARGLFQPALRLVSPALGVTLIVGVTALVGVAAVISVVLAVVVRRAACGPAGLDWLALRRSAALADSIGVDVGARRRQLLAWSAAVGALGGAGGALASGVISSADYSPLLSLQLLVAVVLVGRAAWWSPVIGVAVIAGLPTASDRLATALGIDPLRAETAVTALLLALAVGLRGHIGRLVDRLTLWPGRATDQLPIGGDAPLPVAGATDAAMHARPLLELSGVVVEFGAVRALDGVSVDLRAGEIHAVIGPNGSGKSTLLAVAAGTVRPDAGRATVAGVDAAPAGAAAPRVRSGVVRTWQHPVAFGEGPVRAEVAVGARVGDAMPFAALRHLLATPSSAAVTRARADRSDAAVRASGLAADAGLPAHRLDGAALAALQIARAVATGAAAVLLDEPAAGVAGPQRNVLAQLLRELADSGRGILLVEHDMALVMEVADRVTVLDAGRVIAAGTPAQVRADAATRHAYLGDHALARPTLT